MEAYGFELISKSSAGALGGRPKSVDADEVFIELRRRYEGKPLPKSPSLLREDNPDLAGKLKTIANTCNQEYGDTFKNVLISEGLLDAVATRTKKRSSRDQVESMLDELQEIYSDALDKPKTFKQLTEMHPEYSNELNTLKAYGTEWFGQSARRHLIDLGILAKGVNDIDSDQCEGTIELLIIRYADLSNDQKPSSLKAILEETPELDSQIAAAQKWWNAKSSGTTFVNMLRDKGVLRKSEDVLRRERKAVVAQCVRNATLDELLDVWVRADGALEPMESSSCMLPPRVVGIDLHSKIEVRETMLCASVPASSNLHVGQKLSIRTSGFVLELLNEFGTSVSRLQYDQFGEGIYREIAEREKTGESGSELLSLEGAHVASVSDNPNGSQFAQFRIAYAYPLSIQTMLNLLATSKLITDEDLLGGDAWRTRDYESAEIASGYRNATVGERGIEENACEPATALDANGDPEVEERVEITDAEMSDVEIDTADEDAERDSMLAVLNMAALTASIASNGFPQDILDDLERATNGDRSIDLDDLGRRINDLLPSIHCVDPRAWTFDCGLRAGNGFYSIAIPDGYRLIENYQEDGLIPVTRDYVAIPGTADDIDIPNCDRLIGASFSSMASDSDTSDNMKKLFIEELRLAVMHKAVPPSAISKDATHYVEDLVAAKNCKCLVSLVGNAGGGFEYYIRPLGAEILDYVRVTFHNAEDLSCEPDFRQAVLGLARSVELSNPCKSELQSSLNGLVEKKSSAQDFDETVSTLANVLAISRNFESEAALNKLEADGVFSEDEAFIVSYIEHIAAFNDSAFRHCEQVFNALESQKRMKTSPL